MRLIWSLVERVVARLPSGVQLLLIGIFLTPIDSGVYAWMVLALTFAQAVFDVPLRQVGIEGLRTREGWSYLTRAVRRALAYSLIILGAAFSTLCYVFSTTVPQVLLLFPMILIPLCTLTGLRAVLQLQAQGRWKRIASLQFLAALASMFICIPLMIVTHSILAVALQPLLAEGIAAIGARFSSRGQEILVSEETFTIKAELRSTSLYSLLGWVQGQLDRVLVGAFAGASTLGSFSFAATLGRTPGEAVANASVNVFRTDMLTNSASDDDVRASFHWMMMRVLSLNILIVLFIIGLSKWTFPFILDDHWDEALHALPGLTVSLIPAACTWLITVVLVRKRRTRAALPIRVLGVFLAVAVAVAAMISLSLASWVAAGRELVVFVLSALLIRELAPLKLVATVTSLVFIFAAGAAVGWY